MGVSNNTPIGQGVINAVIQFDRNPPTSPFPRVEDNIIFSSLTYGFNNIKESGDKVSTVEALPEQQGLFGIVLRSKENHYHNFVSEATSDELGVTYLRDENGVVADHLADDASPKRNAMRFFDWVVAHPFYEEKDSSGESLVPLRFSEYANNGQFGALTDTEKLRQRGAKWKYYLKNVPRHDSGLSESGLSLIENDLSRLIPYQSQKQGTSNGPTGIGVHWGLEKFTKLPRRSGFYLNFFLDKDLDNVTNDNIDPKVMPEIHNHSGYFKDYFSTHPGDGTNNQQADQTDISNDDIFEGERKDVNNMFNFKTKSYILICLEEDATTGDAYYILIPSDGFPKCFNINTTEKKITLLSELEGVQGRTLLNGVNGRLTMRFRNLINHLIIDTNVNGVQWVITKSAYRAKRSNTEVAAPSEGRFGLLTIGGKLKIFGGNISCGLSYSMINYADKAKIPLTPFQIYGKDRNMLASFTTQGSGSMPEAMRVAFTSHSGYTSRSNRDSRFYFASAASIIGDDLGSTAVDLSLRPDNFLGPRGSYLIPTELSITKDVDPNGPDSSTVMDIDIGFTPGTVIYKSNGYEFNSGPSMTPVLLYIRRIAELKKTNFENLLPINISDIVTELSLSWEAEDIHAMKQNGSITFNILKPTENSAAHREVIKSLNGARYVRIGAELSCDDLNLGSNKKVGGQVESYNTMFTGLMFNPKVTEEAGKRLVTFELRDYWTILEDNVILNSPYFDGGLDTSVVKYMLEYAGFDTSKKTVARIPESRDVMPISFSFDRPVAKFDDKRQLSDIIKEIAKKYHKIAYFDQEGVFRYEDVPPFLVDVGASNKSVYTPKQRFYSSHIGDNENIKPIGVFHEDANAPKTPTQNHQIAYSQKSYSWFTHDVFNKIVIMSVDARDKGIIIVSDVNTDSLENQDSFGYLGYVKPFIQHDAAFGAYERVQKVLRYYSRMYQPIYMHSWTCYGGVTNLKAFNLVSLDRAYLVLQKITHNIVASENRWETEYEGEWIWPPKNTDATILNAVGGVGG